MSDLRQGISDGLGLLVHGDAGTWQVVGSSLRIAAESTTIAAAIAVPLGCALGLGDFRGRRAALAAVNASVRVPPVVVGVMLMLLLWPVSLWGGGPLAGLQWMDTVTAIVVAQTLLAAPVIAALVASAVQSVPGGLLAQAKAFGAQRRGVAWLALREARLGVGAALIAGFGVASAAVGAVVVIGGAAAQQMLGPAVLGRWGSGDYAGAVAYGLVMFGVFFVLAAGLTVAQLRRGRSAWAAAGRAGDDARGADGTGGADGNPRAVGRPRPWTRAGMS